MIEELKPETPVPILEPKKSSIRRFILPLIILVALVSIAGASFYFYQKMAKPDPISLLPEETAFYIKIKINSEDQQVKDFKEILNKFPYYEKISQKIGQELEKMKEENPALKNLDFTISNEVILALISPLEEGKEEFPFVFILPNPNLKKLEKLAKDVKKAIEESENWEEKEEVYKGRTIFIALPIVKKPSWAPQSYKPPAPKYKPSSAFINGHFFLASKPEDIKKIIDVADSQKITSLFKKEKIKNLTSSSAYKRIKKYLPEDYLVLFYGEVDWSKVLKTTEKEVKTVKETKFFSPFLASLKTALNLPFSKGKEAKEPEKVATAGAIIAEKNQLKSETYSLDLRKDAFLPAQFSFKNSLVNFVPEKIGNREIAFYGEGRDLESSFEEIERTLTKEMKPEEKKEFDDFLKSLNESLGVDFKKDILSLFKKNYAFFVASESSGKEVPSIGFISEVDDESRAKENLLKIKIPKFSPEDILGLSGARKRARDAIITADMAQMRTIAEMIYSDEYGYSNFSCHPSGRYSNDMKNLCKDVKEQVGSEPIIHSSWNRYCAYTKLNEPGSYYCVDSTGKAIQTYINPGATGFCAGGTFLCPTKQGTPSPESFFPSEAEKVGFSKEIIDGFEVYTLPVMENLGLNFSLKDKKMILTFNKQGLIDILKSLSESGKKLKDSEIFAEQFKEIPKDISSISYAYPYGFLGMAKNLVRFYVDFMSAFMGETISETEETQIKKVTSAINELLDKGIAPYLKILKSSGDYSYSPERNLIVTKGRLIIQELSEKEKRETEAFWTNFKLWLMEIMGPSFYY